MAQPPLKNRGVTITSQYAGRCKRCGVSYNVGDTIKGFGSLCSSCQPEEATIKIGDNRLGARPARNITGISYDDNSKFKCLYINGTATSVKLADLSRAELIRTAKLAFPDIAGNKWLECNNTTIMAAINNRKVPMKLTNPDSLTTDDEPQGLVMEITDNGDGDSGGPSDQGTPIQEQQGGTPTDGEGQGQATGQGAGDADEDPLVKRVREIATEVMPDLDENRVKQIAGDLDTELYEMIDKEIERRVNPVVHIKVTRQDGITYTLPDVAHNALADLIMMVKERQHVFMVGPAGSGKSTLAEQAADALGMNFASISMEPTMSPTKLFGFINATGGYVTTPFRNVFENGGVMLVDEMDNGHAGLTAALNQALSNPVAAFGDDMVKRHEDFVCVATGNTYGKGGDRQYVGRNQLDAATLDRFCVLDVDYDEVLEKTLTMAWATDETRPQIEDWLKAVVSLRRKVEKLNLPLVVSPRASIGGARLIAGGMDPDKVAEVRLLAGIDQAMREKLNVRSYCW